MSDTPKFLIPSEKFFPFNQWLDKLGSNGIEFIDITPENLWELWLKFLDSEKPGEAPGTNP